MMETVKRLWRFSEHRRQDLTKALLLSFLRSTLGITQILAVILAVQAVIGAIPVKEALLYVGGLTLLCVGGGFGISYFEQIATLKAGMYTVADQRSRIGQHLRRLPLGFFRKAEAEHLTATLTTTLQGVEMASTMTIVNVVSGFFNSAAFFLFLLWYDWRMGLILGLGILSYLLVVRWQIQVSRRNAPDRQAAQTGLTTAALTFLQGIRVIKSFSFPRGDESLQDAIQKSCQENIRLTSRSMPSQFAAHLTIALFESLFLAGTIFFSMAPGGYSIEKSVVLLIASFFAFASLDQAGSILSMVGMVESGLDEIDAIQKTPALPESTAPEHPGDLELKLEGVRFSYGDHCVLEDISAQIPPHTLTAIIGPSGSGKTTLCRLIARFQDVERGKITLGGVDLRKIPYEELMDQISIVFQNVYLFEDTILNNIRLGNPHATLEEIRTAAKAARCDDFIMALPQGYDTLIQEGGSSLSGGEKQRISIARAILKDAPILILDEATSALDADSERAFFDAVDAVTQNKTVIMIAHRLSTVKRADQILALRDGHLVQKGSPQQLASEPGLYAEFLNARDHASGWTLNCQNKKPPLLM